MIDAWIDEDDAIPFYDEEGNVLADDQCHCQIYYGKLCILCQLSYGEKNE